ncbi:MAG: class A beta-lactamase-related serine hydrolase [Planctomycetaceae bacterium]|nr:MAG: class A beta-lactamase-related serine hydrolase [Planctomycetaceae bacterium]
MIPRHAPTGQPAGFSAAPRRAFLAFASSLSIGSLMTLQAQAETVPSRFEPAAGPLRDAVNVGRINAAAMWVRQGDAEATWNFGSSDSADDPFLIASISKTMTVAGMLALVDDGEIDLDAKASRYLPEFTGDGREGVLVWQLLTHVSGLPDQVANNAELRSSHSPLAAFVAAALRAPLAFPPGTAYSYSSMAILLAAEISRRISGLSLPELLANRLFRPLGMTTTSLGLGGRDPEKLIACQVESAAPESGAGDAAARQWDWNSRYWRDFGAPWGGVHASARDVGRFLWEAMHPSGLTLRAATYRRMTTNQNPAGLTPRGLGFGVGKAASSRYGSPLAFGHTGATGTLAWADPKTDTACVVLTTLPGTAMKPHPRQLASDLVGQLAMS